MTWSRDAVMVDFEKSGAAESVCAASAATTSSARRIVTS
jgi:hypothetical protein